MQLLQEYGSILVIITAVLGFLMAFGIGANDVSNAMGTSVGSGTITVKQAIIIAMVFELAGAYLAGGEVADTIKSGITSGPESIRWGQLTGIVGSWFITPVLAGIVAFAIFVNSQKLIFNRSKPFKQATKYGPFYMGITIFILSIVTISKGLKHVGLHLSNWETFFVSFGLAILATIFGYIYFRSARFMSKVKEQRGFSGVEKIFSILMLLTAFAMAFAHGSNDVANAIGPLAAVESIINNGGQILDKAPMAPWVLPLGAFGMGVGLAVMGKSVMATVGTGITELTPSRGFAAQFACAVTVVLASGTGLPISTTQTLVGAILGVGFARGIAAINLGIIRNIVASWFVTLPAGAVLSIIVYYILHAIFY